jgi:hypothetical protein
MGARASWLQDPLPLSLSADCLAAWMQNPDTVEIRSGGVRGVFTENVTAGDVGRVVRGLADEPDVTVTISGSHPSAREIVIAVSEDNCFLSLLSPDGGVYQHVAAGSEQPGARITFTIQGAVTGIGSRWVADPGTAAAAVREWLAADRGAALSGNWVKM